MAEPQPTGWWRRLFSGGASAHWEATPFYGGSEHRNLVQDSDGRVLIVIVHGQGPRDTWCVCEGPHGTYFTTEAQAKKFAESRIWANVHG